MNTERKSKKLANPFYFNRFLDFFPKKIPWPVLTLLIITAIFVITGYGIIFDLLTGVFPSNLFFLRNLFFFSWISSVLFFVLSVYLSNKFHKTIFFWIDTQYFLKEENSKKLRKTVNRIFKTSFGPIPIVVAIAIYLVRHISLALFFSAPPIDVLPDAGQYTYWYLGADFSYSFIVLLGFWSMLVASAVLWKVAGSFPIQINDLSDYKESYEDLTKLANTHIILIALAIAIFVFGVLYWGLSVGTSRYYLAMFLLLLVTGMGVSLFSWLNLSGIQKGLEKTKKEKIKEIRKLKMPSYSRDLQISLHSQISLRRIGPRLLDNFIAPLIVAELPTLLKLAFDLLS
jgi:hypothetical protein